MTTEVATTELEAVNTMLSCIGEAPVSTLETSGLTDVAVAKSVLNEVSREVQTKGYHFNSEDDYPLPRNGDYKIPLAANMVRVDVDHYTYPNYDVVQRGRFLYWRNEHTFEFDRDLRGSVVFLLPFDQLPQEFRNLIMIRASRRFQARQLGSDTKHKFSESDELTAASAILNYEMDAADPNMLRGSWSVARILQR